ncbi:MAG: hypothetical protein ACLQDV_22450 [Candidatus Binataceae bacterium]
MGRPRLHPRRNTLAAIVTAAAMILTVTGRAAAMGPWQTSWGDYDSHDQWHDASWWLHNRHDWVIVHHPEWTDNYASTRGQIGDSDRFHEWHYGDGGFDRSSTGLIIHTPLNGSAQDRGASLQVRASIKNS